VAIRLIGSAWIGLAPLAAQEASRDVAFVEAVTGRVVAFASGTPALLAPLDGGDATTGAALLQVSWLMPEED
jgi:hypothetical protein